MRIRTIKPEWLDDGRMSACSSDARVLSVGLILHADDEGRGRLTRALPFVVFPSATNPIRTFDAAMAELRDWFVVEYEANGDQLFELPNFAKHQVINRPKPSKIPASSDASLTDHGSITDESVTDQCRKGKGKGNREGEQGTGKGTGEGLDPGGSSAVAERVFSVWVEAFKKSPSTTLTPTRRSKITARLRRFTADQLCEAVRNAAKDPWRQEAPVRHELATLLRSDEHVENHLATKPKPLRATGSDPATWGDRDRYESTPVEELFG